MDILNEIFESQNTNSSKSAFFTDDSPEGYFSKAEFLQLVRQLKGSWRLGHLKSLFENMNLQKKLMGSPTTDNDNGMQVIWARFGYGNLRQNLNIHNSGRMFDLIMDYANGKLSHVKTLEELLVEAAQIEA